MSTRQSSYITPRGIPPGAWRIQSLVLSGGTLCSCPGRCSLVLSGGRDAPWSCLGEGVCPWYLLVLSGEYHLALSPSSVRNHSSDRTREYPLWTDKTENITFPNTTHTCGKNKRMHSRQNATFLKKSLRSCMFSLFSFRVMYFTVTSQKNTPALSLASRLK